jgi:hypothetical protein
MGVGWRLLWQSSRAAFVYPWSDKTCRFPAYHLRKSDAVAESLRLSKQRRRVVLGCGKVSGPYPDTEGFNRLRDTGRRPTSKEENTRSLHLPRPSAFALLSPGEKLFPITDFTDRIYPVY